MDDLFADKGESERRKEEGMARARTESRAAMLAEARGAARRLATERGTITSDDVAIEYKYRKGIDLGEALGPAGGSIFRGKDWEWTGEVKRSIRARQHRTLLRVWRLR
jgi:hypothetical protein